MSNLIRKIIVGTDVVKDSMVYTVGQRFGRNKEMEITNIIIEDDGTCKIYVESNGEEFIWKRFSSTVATTIEYSTTF